MALTILIGLAAGRIIAPGLTDDAAPSGNADVIEALNDHLADNPDDVTAWQQLGTAHVEEARDTDDLDQYLAARDAFARAEELSPGHPDTERGRAIVALGLHRFAEARDLALAAHESRPYDPVALAALIDAEVEMGRYDEATRRVDDLLAIRPDAAALSRMSYLRELQGDGDGALDAMLQARVAAEGSPRDRARIDTLLGDLYAARGDLERADAAYERALEARPGLTDAVVGQARILAAAGRIDEALNRLDTTDTSGEGALMLLVELSLLAGREAEAAEYQAVLDANIDAELAAGFGLDPPVAIHESTWGNPERGLELARRVHQARPEHVGAADALAWALLQTGDTDGARAAAVSAVRLDSYDAALQYRAAEVFAAAGDDAQALRHLERARSIDPAVSVGPTPALDALTHGDDAEGT